MQKESWYRPLTRIRNHHHIKSWNNRKTFPITYDSTEKTFISVQHKLPGTHSWKHIYGTFSHPLILTYLTIILPTGHSGFHYRITTEKAKTGNEVALTTFHVWIKNVVQSYLNGRVIRVLMGRKESAFDLTSVWILAIPIKDFTIQIHIVHIYGPIESNCDHLRHLKYRGNGWW